jgi:hypothetical protein
MKHLRRYNESISDVNDMKEIEELFYPLSDEHYLNVTVTKDLNRSVKFDKPIMHHGREDVSKHKNMGSIPFHILDNPTYPIIRVLIAKSPIVSHSLINEPKYKMDINTFADELRFPIDYLLKEKGLKLDYVWASRQVNYGNDYPTYLYYKDLDALVGDQNMGKSMLALVLYFGD